MKANKAKNTNKLCCKKCQIKFDISEVTRNWWIGDYLCPRCCSTLVKEGALKMPRKKECDCGEKATNCVELKSCFDGSLEKVYLCDDCGVGFDLPHDSDFFIHRNYDLF